MESIKPPLPPKSHKSESIEGPPLPSKSQTISTDSISNISKVSETSSSSVPPLPKKDLNQAPPLPPKLPSKNHSTSINDFNSLEIANLKLETIENGEIINKIEGTQLKVDSDPSKSLFYLRIDTLTLPLTKEQIIFSDSMGRYIFQLNNLFYSFEAPKETSRDLLENLEVIFETHCGSNFLSIERNETKMLKEKGFDLYKVFQEYQAQDLDELSLHIGDLVSVFHKESEEWWYGQCKGVRGWFPPDSVMPVSTKNLEMANTASKKIEKGGQVVGKGIIKGAELLGTGIKKTTDHMKAHTKPCEKEEHVTVEQQKSVENANKISSGLAVGTKKVALGFHKGASYLGSTATKHYKQSDYYKKKELENSKKDPSQTKEGLTQVGGASVNAVGSVITGIGEGLKITFNNVKENSVSYQEHKHGSEVAELHKKKWDVGEGAIKTVKNVKDITPIRAAISVGKGAFSQGEEVLYLGGATWKENYGAYQDWAVEIWHYKFFRLKSLCVAFYDKSVETETTTIVKFEDVREVLFPVTLKNPHSKYPFNIGLRTPDYIVHIAFEKEQDAKEWVNCIKCLKKFYEGKTMG